MGMEAQSFVKWISVVFNRAENALANAQESTEWAIVSAHSRLKSHLTKWDISRYPLIICCMQIAI